MVYLPEEKISKKYSGQKSKPMSSNIFFNMLHLVMRFGVSGSSFNSSDRHANHNLKELRNISQETKETEKTIKNLPTNLPAILVPGVLLTERILSSASYQVDGLPRRPTSRVRVLG